eukprot:3657727-Rhodomonas_salina.2
MGVLTPAPILCTARRLQESKQVKLIRRSTTFWFFMGADREAQAKDQWTQQVPRSFNSLWLG